MRVKSVEKYVDVVDTDVKTNENSINTIYKCVNSADKYETVGNSEKTYGKYVKAEFCKDS